MIQRVKALTRSRFVRNVAIVATGTASAQAITMAFSPIITRLYGPEAFGLLGTFMAILAVLTPMAALTYPIAIVLPKQDAEAKGLVKLSIVLALGVSAIALVLILVWGSSLAQLLGADSISQYLWLIPFSMFFAALHQVLEQWLIRHQQFKVAARAARHTVCNTQQHQSRRRRLVSTGCRFDSVTDIYQRLACTIIVAGSTKGYAKYSSL